MHEMILLDEGEAAAFLRVQRKTLSAWRVRGTGPVFRKIGRLVKYLRSDLEDYILNQARQSTSNPDRVGRNRKAIVTRRIV